MRILFLTDNYPPEVNAPASRTYDHVRVWHNAGHEIIRAFQLRVVKRVRHHLYACRAAVNDTFKIGRGCLCHGRVGSVRHNLTLQLPVFRAEHDSGVRNPFPQTVFRFTIGYNTLERKVGIGA